MTLLERLDEWAHNVGLPWCIQRHICWWLDRSTDMGEYEREPL